MESRKCSMRALDEYKKSINNYLKNKNINDFSKYKISFKEDKLHYDSWEYPSNIEKPLNVTPIYDWIYKTKLHNNYYDTKTRTLIIQ